MTKSTYETKYGRLPEELLPAHKRSLHPEVIDDRMAQDLAFQARSDRLRRTSIDTRIPVEPATEDEEAHPTSLKLRTRKKLAAITAGTLLVGGGATAAIGAGLVADRNRQPQPSIDKAGTYNSDGQVIKSGVELKLSPQARDEAEYVEQNGQLPPPSASGPN